MKYNTQFDTLDGFYDALYSIPARPNRHNTTPQAVTKRLLEALGNPQNDFRSVLITGSKGKGSTALFLSALINRSGARVGRFVSPHLFDYRERIAIDNDMIDETTLLQLGKCVLDIANSLEIQHPDEFPRFFEVTTAIAYLYFAESGVDIAVVETGIGAQTDATNQGIHELSILTHIEDEHGDIFGSLADIVKEKSGVIKVDTPLILGDFPEEIDQNIMAVASEFNAPVTRFKRQYIPNNSGYYQLKVGADYWICDSLPKAKNAWIALTAFTQLNFHLSDGDKVDVLSNTPLPARQEIISRKPFIIIDSAHSKESAQSLANYVKKLVTYKIRRKVLLLSFSAQKNILPVYSVFSNADSVVLTQATEKRSLPTAQVAEYLASHTTAKPQLIEDPRVAIEKTIKQLKPDDVLVITGSVYLAGLASEWCRSHGFCD